MAVKPHMERKTRFGRLIADPELMDTLCAHVANGGTVIDLCETYDVPFGWLSNWVNQDTERAKRYMRALNDRAEWGRERILAELRAIGTADIRQLYTEQGKLKPPAEWPRDIARAISGVETDELFEGAGKEREQIGWTQKVKMNDKIRALELLGKNLALFVDRVEHSGKVTLAELVAASHLEENKGE